jgi:sulfate/thiosulfate transport system substrate-binding protein
MHKIVMMVIALTSLAAMVTACGGSDKVALVAYSTPAEAYKEIIPAFQKTTAGKDVQFSESYGASGEQSRAVEAGLKADVVEFSLAPDMDRLVKAGIVASSWNQNQYKGDVTESVVVLVVRKGNPKGIKTWDDLTKAGVQVIEPNPFTSGGAKWNIMAAYGAQLKAGKTPEEAAQFLKDLFANVAVQDKSARDALQTFVGGKGDVLLSYENEAITAIQKGEDVEYIVPDATILIQNPVAVTEGSPVATQAKAFVDFLYTEDAQKIFVAKGYRSVLPDLNDPATFPTPAQLFTIDDLGGWSTVNDKFFDPDGSIVADIEQGLGVSTAK